MDIQELYESVKRLVNGRRIPVITSPEPQAYPVPVVIVHKHGSPETWTCDWLTRRIE